jgi:hypothetical protein
MQPMPCIDTHKSIALVAGSGDEGDVRMTRFVRCLPGAAPRAGDREGAGQRRSQKFFVLELAAVVHRHGAYIGQARHLRGRWRVRSGRQVALPVDRDGEVQVLAFLELQCGDADQPASRVKQAAAAGAGRDRRAGLDQHQLAVVVVAPQRGHQAVRKGGLQPARIAQCVDFLADAEAVAVAQFNLGGAQVACGDLAQVARDVDVLQPCVVLDVLVADDEALGFLQHVAVDQQLLVVNHHRATSA